MNKFIKIPLDFFKHNQMIKIFSFAMAFLCSLSYSQQQIQVLDAETQKPVPYAKLILKGKDYYRNTEENGKITLEKDEEPAEIESFGYENFRTEKFQSVYLLKPKFIDIAEVEIVRPKLSKSFKIGVVKKTNNFYGAGNINWSVGKEIKNELLSEPLFVKSLKFYAKLHQKKSATIKLNIYRSDTGVPAEIYRSYVITCYKNKKFTEYIFEKPLSLPKEGFIIAFEWIFNNENQFQQVMIFNGKKKTVIAHEPMIGAIQDEPKNIILGHLIDGRWNYNNSSNHVSHKMGNLGIELELTN